MIAVAVTVVSSGALAAASISAAGGGSVGLGAGISVAFGGTVAGVGAAAGATFGLTTAGLVAVGATSAAIGSAVSQGFGVATGLQNQFSWGAVALAGISGAVGGGLGSIGALRGGAGVLGVAQGAARGALGNLATQGFALATGLQDRFNWSGVATGAAVGGAIGAVGTARLGPLVDRLAGGVTGALAGAAARSLLDGTDFGDTIVAALPDVIGSTIGEMFAGAVAGGRADPADDVESTAGFARASSPTSHASSLGGEEDRDIRPDVVVTASRLGTKGGGFFSRLWNRIEQGATSLWRQSGADRLVMRITAATERFRSAAATQIATIDRRYQITATYHHVADTLSAVDRRYLVTTRAMGGLQAVGGGAEIVGGTVAVAAGLAGEPLTFGASTLAVVGGGATMLAGADNAQAGLRAMFSGQSSNTVGGQVIAATTGLSANRAELLYGGAQLVTGVGAGAAARIAGAAERTALSPATNVVDGVRLRSQLMSQEIAGGHAFEKHVLGTGNPSQAEFGGLGIRTRNQFAEHIEKVINNPTQSGALRGGREYFYDRTTNTIVIRNPRAADGGTAFRPADPDKYLKEQLR